MKKAIMQSKWRWYIPVISFFFIEEQAEWVWEAKDQKDIYYRDILIIFLLVINISIVSLSFVLYFINY